MYLRTLVLQERERKSTAEDGNMETMALDISKAIDGAKKFKTL